MAEGLGEFTPVDLREQWTDEGRDFTPWLAEDSNLARLSVVLGMELELEGIEVSVGPYKADIVARDISSDSRVVIENQLDKTNHDHLGKVLTYASGLEASAVIWIAREFSDEHKRALDYINEKAAPDLHCYGIEIQLWRIDEGRPAPLFKVVSSPNEYAESVRIAERELTDSQKLYLDLWTEFRQYCQDKGTALRLPKPYPQYWYAFAIGRSGFLISVSASIQKRRLGCELYLGGANAKKAFKLLGKDRAEIEATTGPLDWQELADKRDARIVLYRLNVDVTDRANWVEAFAWMKEKAETFLKAFLPTVKALPVLDTVTVEEPQDE